MKSFNNTLLSESITLDGQHFSTVILGKQFVNKHIMFLIDYATKKRVARLHLKDKNGVFKHLLLVEKMKFHRNTIKLKNGRKLTFSGNEDLKNTVILDNYGIFRGFYPKSQDKEEEVKSTTSATIAKVDAAV